MKTATLLPLNATGIAQLINAETAEVAPIAYLPGRPRQYRFDAIDAATLFIPQADRPPGVDALN